MNYTYYIFYLIISFFVTFVFGRDLHKHGRLYVLLAFKEEKVTDAINNVLLMGYYALNFGFILIMSKDWPFNLSSKFRLEALTTNLSFLLLTLAVIHYSNLIWIKLIQIYNQKQVSPKP